MSSFLLHLQTLSNTTAGIFLAAVPVIILIVLLGFLKISGVKSAVITLLTAVIIAVFTYGFAPCDTAAAFLFGAVKAFFPILFIVVMAIFSYNVLIFTGKMEIIKHQFAAISSDKSTQVLLLTWGFGGLLEGMAGFGTAVAIPAAILISLGFKPFFAAVTSLMANSVATAFGAIGTPVKVLALETATGSVEQLGCVVVMQLAPLMFIVPFAIMFITAPTLKALPKNIILSVIVGAVSLVVQYFSALYMGPEVPAIMGSLASIICIIIFGKFTEKNKAAKTNRYSTKESLTAWSVYALIVLFVVGTSSLFPGFRALLQSVCVTKVPFMIAGVQKYHLIPWLTEGGLLVFLGALLGGLIQGAKVTALLRLLGKTVYQQRKTLVMVSCLIGMSTIMDFAGMIGRLGTGIAMATGSLYPFFAPFIGCLGTFLTGSDTSSNILFAKLQTTVASQIGVDPQWLAAANTAGATGGKIISPQSIAVATSAIGQQGQEGEILKRAVPFALFYVIVVGLTIYIFA